MTSIVDRFVELMKVRVVALKAADTPWELHQRINEADHTLLSDLLSPEEEEQVLAHAGPELLRDSQDVFCRYETILEKSMAAYLGAADPRALQSRENITQNYRQRYRHLTANEVRLSGLGATDRVLFVGSGPLPITAIEYVLQSGCTVTCIDHFEEPVRISTEIIRHLGLADRFRIVQGRGQDFPVAGYDVILVGVLAQPKAQILAHIDRSADPRCRLLCRTTTGVRQFIYPRTAPVALDRFRPAGFSRAVGDQAISTQLLTTEGSARGWEESR